MTVVQATFTDSATIRDIYLKFFGALGTATPFNPQSIDPIVRATATDTLHSWRFSIPNNILSKYANVGILIACIAYRHAPREVRIAIALFTACATMSDDNVLPTEILREFSERLFDGRPQLHPILSRLVEVLRDMRNHYTCYGANIITVNTADFFNAEMFNRDEGGTDLVGTISPEYVEYIRWKTGVGEAYAAFIWPKSMFPETKTYIQAIPLASQYICLGNDLLSFYKEAKAGDTDNFVSQYSAVLGQTRLQTLRGVAERVIATHERIIAILGDTPERKAWESFAIGYCNFHAVSPRYSLKEIIPEFYAS